MSSPEGCSTQISGRYSPDNPGIFALRQRLVDLGVNVRFPAGSEIIEYVEGFAVTTPDERTRPFPETELSFLNSIGTSDFHIAYNIWGEESGYIGESTAIETIYAMAYNVPTVWLRPFGRLSPSIGSCLRIFVERIFEMSQPHIEPLDLMPDAELAAAIGRLASRQSGIHEWSAHIPRPVFENGIKNGTMCHWDPPKTTLWPLIDGEDEIFWDREQELQQKYAEAWDRYSASSQRAA